MSYRSQYAQRGNSGTCCTARHAHRKATYVPVCSRHVCTEYAGKDKGTAAVTRKRTKPLDTHKIDINPVQLNSYCDEVEVEIGVPVYYVLPQPPWVGLASRGVVPGQAAYRTTSDAGPFERWAYVSRCTDLRTQLAGGRTIFTDRLPLPGCCNLAEFLRHV